MTFFLTLSREIKPPVESVEESSESSFPVSSDVRVNEIKLNVLVLSEAVRVVEEQEPALGVFCENTGPVFSLQVHEGLLYTCSRGKAVRAYSLLVRRRRRHSFNMTPFLSPRL